LQECVVSRRSSKPKRTRFRILALGAAGLLVAGLAVAATPASAAPTRYEAENATISLGHAESTHAGFSGTGYVNTDNVVGSSVQWTINAPTAGQATLTFRFANGVTTDRPMTIAVNGSNVATPMSFPPTGAWPTWASKSITATVNAGNNTVKATATTAGGGPNLDFLDVDIAAPSSDFQAENAMLSQATVATNHTGFTGTGFVDYTNVAGGFIEWTVNAAASGNVNLVIRHANGSTANRPLSISVNGTVVNPSVSFNPTGNWDTWADVTIPASLNAGDNTVRATATGTAGGPNVDRLSVNSGGGGDTQPPSIPANLRVTGVTSSSISLAWNASTDNVGVTGYRVFEGATQVASPTGTSATITGLAPNSTHTYTVTARDAAGNESSRSAPVTGTTSGGGTPGMAVAPYIYFGFGTPTPDPVNAMNVTGIRWFTMAFMLASGPSTCNPLWDGTRSLTTSEDAAKIAAIRNAGGDVIVSFGGAEGNKLGAACTSASALAGAYQKVINTYNLRVIDIDIEAGEVASATIRQRVIDALKIIKTNNPGIITIITLGTDTTGPIGPERDMITRGAASSLNNDVWGIMPFDFGSHSGTMGDATKSAAEGLKNALKSSYGYSDAVAYAHMGISSMNGKTDVGETVTIADFNAILAYAQLHHIPRLTFWSLNRDRQCGGGLDSNGCSGVSQAQFDYTKVFARYTG
jgi:chitinase